MGLRKISKYELIFNDKTEQPRIILRYLGPDGGNCSDELWPKPENAVYVADMLRNEKPIYWDPETRIISTSAEPVGEAEAKAWSRSILFFLFSFFPFASPFSVRKRSSTCYYSAPVSLRQQTKVLGTFSVPCWIHSSLLILRIFLFKFGISFCTTSHVNFKSIPKYAWISISRMPAIFFHGTSG